ncbi:hypothetical protein ACOI9V_12895, partial [Corynebacterium striatum]
MVVDYLSSQPNRAGYQVSTKQGSGPPLQALNQAIVCAKKTTGLVHHSDHGSQYVSIIYNERLAEHGI